MSDTLNTSTNVQEKDTSENSSKLVEIHERKPFAIVETEQGCFIAIGNRRVSENMSKEEAEEEIEYKSWKLITSLMVVIAEELHKENQEAPKVPLTTSTLK